MNVGEKAPDVLGTNENGQEILLMNQGLIKSITS